jgi:hypothetical protein
MRFHVRFGGLGKGGCWGKGGPRRPSRFDRVLAIEPEPTRLSGPPTRISEADVERWPEPKVTFPAVECVTKDPRRPAFEIKAAAIIQHADLARLDRSRDLKSRQFSSAHFLSSQRSGPYLSPYPAHAISCYGLTRQDTSDGGKGQ